MSYFALLQIARKVGDPNTPRPWRQYSSKKQENATETAAGAKLSGVIDSKVGKKVVGNSEDDDPQLQEFLQVMQPRARSKMWENDILLDTPVNQNRKVTEKKDVAQKKGRQTSATLDVDIDETNTGLDDNETKASDNHARDEVISDMDYFKSRVKKDWSDSESDDNEENYDGDQNREHNSENVKQDQIEEGSPDNPDGEILGAGNQPSGFKDDRDEDLESGRLFVRNLPFTSTYISLHTHHCLSYLIFFWLLWAFHINILLLSCF